MQGDTTIAADHDNAGQHRLVAWDRALLIALTAAIPLQIWTQSAPAKPLSTPAANTIKAPVAAAQPIVPAPPVPQDLRPAAVNIDLTDALPRIPKLKQTRF
ncbi:MAG: hypothetical protein AAF290_01475 [Pseudomonadota bacterium]